MSETPKTIESAKIPDAAVPAEAPEASGTSATPVTPEIPELTIAIPQAHNPQLNAEIQQWAEANNIPTAITDPKLQESIAEYGTPWFRSAAVVVNNGGRILMIHEGRVQIKKIKDEALKQQKLAEGRSLNDWVDGDGGWNMPSGRLGLGEVFEDGAERETKEESGWKATIKQYLCTRTGKLYIMPIFLARANHGPAQFRTTETRETLEIAWLTVEEIRKLHADNKLRSPEFVSQALDAYEKTIA